MYDLKLIRQRAEQAGIPFKVWCRLASLPDSKIYQPNLSNFFDGEKMSEPKVQRLLKVLADVEDLVNSTVVRPDLSDADNVRAALQNLQEKRESFATAEWTPRAAELRTATQDAEGLTKEHATTAVRILAEDLQK
jgi:hypothetical protein